MTFKFFKTNFSGDPNLGLYGFATDSYCLMGYNNWGIFKKVKDILRVKTIETTIDWTVFVGLFSAGNKNGLIISHLVNHHELKKLKENLDVNIEIIKSRETAIGNLVLCNDKGCLISENLRSHKRQISDALDCEVVVGKIAGLEIVGSAAVTSNVGCLCHRNTTEEEIKKVEDILKVKVDIGTVNYGSPYIKAGIIVNSNGYVISEESTGAELGRTWEVFAEEV